jgi:NAD(P)H-dependent FMN reductase
MADRPESARSTRVLAMSGSLRRASSNTALVEALARLAPAGVTVAVYGELGEIPPFNPDLDVETIAPVRRFRAALDACDALVISSPEYAHGVPGALKNALDWIVGSGELIDKPVALINTSSRATHAHASLTEILTTMSARVVEEASPVVPLDGKQPTAADIVADATWSAAVSAALAALVRAAGGRNNSTTTAHS